MTSQERLDVDFDARAWHGQLEATDDVRVKDTEVSDAFAVRKDLSAAAGEEGGVWKTDRQDDGN